MRGRDRGREGDKERHTERKEAERERERRAQRERERETQGINRFSVYPCIVTTLLPKKLLILENSAA